MQEYIFRSLLDVKLVRYEREASFVSRVKENVYPLTRYALRLCWGRKIARFAGLFQEWQPVF